MAGSIATYLVIILQFQGINGNNLTNGTSYFSYEMEM